MPPLRERKEDIFLLAKHLSAYAREIGKPVMGFHESALEFFHDYSWPGNVRELQNIIERAVLITDIETIYPEHLPEEMKTTNPFLSEALDKSLSIENYTRQFIERYQSSLSEQKLAAGLGITRKALWEKEKSGACSEMTRMNLPNKALDLFVTFIPIFYNQRLQIVAR